MNDCMYVVKYYTICSFDFEKVTFTFHYYKIKISFSWEKQHYTNVLEMDIIQQ